MMYLPYVLALLLIVYILATERELDRQRRRARKAYIAGYERGVRATKTEFGFTEEMKNRIA